jgi:hypothetical protein
MGQRTQGSIKEYRVPQNGEEDDHALNTALRVIGCVIPQQKRKGNQLLAGHVVELENHKFQQSEIFLLHNETNQKINVDIVQNFPNNCVPKFRPGLRLLSNESFRQTDSKYFATRG